MWACLRWTYLCCVSAEEIKTAVKTFASLPHMWNVSSYKNNTEERQRKRPQDQLFSSHTDSQTHTHPIVVWRVRTASFTSRPETPTDTDRPRCVLMWCKHVLECIRTRPKEEEEENMKEVIFFCWRSFLFGDMNAAKNKRRPLSRCAFHWSRKRETERENSEGRREVLYRAIKWKERQVHMGLSSPHIKTRTLEDLTCNTDPNSKYKQADTDIRAAVCQWLCI